MNEMLELMKTRRSCRAYADKPVPKELLDQVIEAGLYAPSGKNTQNPIFIVNQDKEIIQTLSRMNAAVMGVDKDTFYGAPAVITVLGQRDNVNTLADGSCAMENLMLAAHALGLATCWINRAAQVFDAEDGKALLAKWDIEGDYVGVGHCIIGYAANELPAPMARKENRVFFAD